MNRVLVQCVLASAAIASVGILAPATRADTVVRFDMNYSVNSSSGPLNYFEVQLYDTAAPITVANFLKYVNDGLYNNTIVHRDAKDFVMQGRFHARDRERNRHGLESHHDLPADPK